MNTNYCVLIGNLTHDVDLRYTPSGKAVANFSIAVGQPTAQDKEQETDYFDIVVWGSYAENVAKYCQKGRKVCVQGRLRN